MILLKYLIVIVMGYLLGSVPFGLIVSRMQAKVDIRNYGSGRTGGTNVLRTLGRKAFVMVAAGDILKAAVAVFIAGAIMGHGNMAVGHLNIGVLAARSLCRLRHQLVRGWRRAWVKLVGTGFPYDLFASHAPILCATSASRAHRPGPLCQ